MRQTTRVMDRDTEGPLADAGPYAYGPPATLDGARPAPAPQPAPRAAGAFLGWSWEIFWLLLLMNISARALHDLSPLTRPQSFVLAYGLGTILAYWRTPKPREGFLRWTLKVVGLFLNFYFGLVSVPESLRGVLPDAWAFGLPAFGFLLALHIVPPLLKVGRDYPFWQWLLFSAALAALWGWAGPGFVR